MPDDWQYKFVGLLDELENTEWIKLMSENESYYDVRLRNKKGRYIHDPLNNYDRGRRNVFDELDKKNGLKIQN
jgi:hypothetical protein